MRLFFALYTIALASNCFGQSAPSSGQSQPEIGDLNGAAFRIDVPASWNGSLVMYCHGYSAVAVKYDHPKVNPILQSFLDQGFAVAQSGYSAGGWAVEEAVEDTEALRRYFGIKYAAPKETYVTGHSMGGFLTMALMEKFPNVYKGGLPLCGPLAPASEFMLHGAFDGRVLFDFYFPGVLPSPADVPANFQNSKEKDKEILQLLDSKPRESAILRQYAGAHSNADMAGTLDFVTYVLKEIEHRAGGNPFDNRNTIYPLLGDENAVNSGVKRYKADAKAVEYLRTHYTPTGRLAGPMLAVHTSYDPLVPTWVPNLYSERARQAGNAELFVQQFVKHDGHCAINAEETKAAFIELQEWIKTGKAPQGGIDETRASPAR